MIGEIGFECREINMILKLDQYTGNGVVHCNDKSNLKCLLEEVSHRIKDKQNWRYCEKCIVIGLQSHGIVHEHVKTWETISV